MEAEVDELIVREELFPTAQAPGAESFDDVIAAWKARGLEPVEVAKDAVIQRIEITHDPTRGELSWKTTGNMDGLHATLLAMQATCLIVLKIQMIQF